MNRVSEEQLNEWERMAVDTSRPIPKILGSHLIPVERGVIPALIAEIRASRKIITLVVDVVREAYERHPNEKNPLGNALKDLSEAVK